MTMKTTIHRAARRHGVDVLMYSERGACARRRDAGRRLRADMHLAAGALVVHTDAITSVWDARRIDREVGRCAEALGAQS